MGTTYPYRDSYEGRTPKESKEEALLAEIRKFYGGSWTDMHCKICGVSIEGTAVYYKLLKKHMRWHQEEKHELELKVEMLNELLTTLVQACEPTTIHAYNARAREVLRRRISEGRAPWIKEGSV